MIHPNETKCECHNVYLSWLTYICIYSFSYIFAVDFSTQRRKPKDIFVGNKHTTRLRHGNKDG